MGKKVLLGLSGGVDSSVCAYLLKKQGYEVIGLFVKTWNTDDPHCPAEKDAEDARNVASSLNIPFYSFDASEKYEKDVFSQFLSQHKRGRTPNVDLLCNKFIKFGYFLDVATQLDCDFVATGHYAALKNGKLTIPTDKNKDQTYFLAYTNPQAFKKVLFPLQNLTKSEVRTIAEDQNLITATKKDSVGICMVGARPYQQFVSDYFSPKKGNFIDVASRKVVGTHAGATFYTLGQRKLGIGGVKGFPESPWFVIGKNLEKNEVFVSQKEEYLLKNELLAIHPNFFEPQPDMFECLAKIRYRSPAYACKVQKTAENQLKVSFTDPVRSPTPGQAIVFYNTEGIVLAGAEIDEIIR